jgi:hypothetical protein
MKPRNRSFEIWKERFDQLLRRAPSDRVREVANMQPGRWEECWREGMTPAEAYQRHCKPWEEPRPSTRINGDESPNGGARG